MLRRPNKAGTAHSTPDTNDNGISTPPSNTAPTLSALTPQQDGAAAPGSPNSNYTDTAAADTFFNTTGTLIGNDAPGTTFTYGISGGTVAAGESSLAGTYGIMYVNTTTGAYRYVPNATVINALQTGPAVTDVFTLSVSDGALSGTRNLTINITGANDTPILTAPTAITYTDTVVWDAFDTSTGNSFSATDADSTVTYGITGVTASGGFASQEGTYGTLSINTATGAYTYTPDATAMNTSGTNVTDVFSVTATDGSLTDTEDFTVNINQSGTTETNNADTLTGTVAADDIRGLNGNDTISGLGGSDTLTGGEGADTLTGGAGADTYNLSETTPQTDTLIISTGSTYALGIDVANNFQLGNGNVTNTADRLDLPSDVIAANTGGTVDGTDVGTIHTHSITAGIVTFNIAITSVTDYQNAVGYLSQALAGGGETVAFVADISSTNHTYVFQDNGVVGNGHVVDLVGVTATSVDNTGSANGALWVF